MCVRVCVCACVCECVSACVCECVGRIALLKHSMNWRVFGTVTMSCVTVHLKLCSVIVTVSLTIAQITRC